jgi:hypothetical protein
MGLGEGVSWFGNLLGDQFASNTWDREKRKQQCLRHAKEKVPAFMAGIPDG